MKLATDFGDLGSALGACLVLLIVAALAAVLWAGPRARQRSGARMGDQALVAALVRGSHAWLRRVQATLLLIGAAAFALALARPQAKSGTKLLPATTLDVVITLDFSKSMYARDVAPSRIARAKLEVAELVKALPGARFGAVAFAGEAMSFPLTSDGAAIAQFFRQLEPNDMPVGGTAIARALERAREVFLRDPKAKDHERVIVLITDGEDLEGDPVRVAEKARAEGVRIDVVQIGGRTAEPIPELDESGAVVGMRTDRRGKTMTSQLSAAGEKQLASIAETTAGTLVRSERGETGLASITSGLRRAMREELSERAIVVWDDLYVYPLALALALLGLEAFLVEGWRRRGAPKKLLAARAARAAKVGLATLALLSMACEWDPAHPLQRWSPEVDQAIGALESGDAGAAERGLAEYLGTTACKDGELGSSPRFAERPHASLDLGLALFRLGEAYGQRFTEDDGKTQRDPSADAERDRRVTCALMVVREIAQSGSSEDRARAAYLEGNLLFLDGKHEGAIEAYDRALLLAPPAEGDDSSLGADAAYNRALALRRKRDRDQDGGADGGGGDGGGDASNDEGGTGDGGQDPEGDGGDNDAGDSGSGDPRDDDAGADAGAQTPPPENQDAGAPPPEPGDDAGSAADAGAPPAPTDMQDGGASSAESFERLLDELERAHTVQEEVARKNKRQVRPENDK